MTLNFITLGKFFLPAAALSMSVFEMTDTKAHVADDDLPITCEIAVKDGAYGPTYMGLVHATESVSGSYTMKFAKSGANSASINQSGNFSVKAGETATLGQAGFGGNATVDAKLVVEFDGKRMTCATPDAIDL